MTLFEQIRQTLYASEPKGLRAKGRTRGLWYIPRRVFTVSSRPRRHQMESLLVAAASRYEAVKDRTDSRLDIARDTLLSACEFMDRLKTTRAMATLHRYDELMIDFDPESELRARKLAVRDEVAAPQFEEVRNSIISQLDQIDFEDSAKAEQNRALLRKAVELRNLNVEAQFIRKAMLRSLLSLLAGAIIVLIAVAALIVCLTAKSLGVSVREIGFAELMSGMPKYLLAGTFGAIGATFSAMMNFASSK